MPRKFVADGVVKAIARAERKAPPSSLNTVKPVPASWPLKAWDTMASHVYPCKKRSAQRLIALHVDELIECNAITRIGKDVVIIGVGWMQFLHRHAQDVRGFKAGPLIGKERKERAAAAASQQVA